MEKREIQKILMWRLGCIALDWLGIYIYITGKNKKSRFRIPTLGRIKRVGSEFRPWVGLGNILFWKFLSRCLKIKKNKNKNGEALFFQNFGQK